MCILLNVIQAMLTVMLSEFLGESAELVREASTPQPLSFSVCDAVDSNEVPLIVQQNRIKNEQDPEKRRALEKQYEDLIRVSEL